MNILSKKDLHTKQKKTYLPRGVGLPVADSNRRLFFSPSTSQDIFACDKNGSLFLMLSSKKNSSADSDFILKKRQKYFYLWKAEKLFHSPAEEIASCMVYVSLKGNIILSYPDKLSVDSRNTLRFQEYIRNSAYFMDSRFFWTKIEQVW